MTLTASPQVFRGRTLEEAERTALRALGEGCVILTKRRVPRSGLAGNFGRTDVEISATVEAPPPPVAPPAPRQRTSPFARGVYEENDAAPRDEVSALRNEMRGELRNLRRALARPDVQANIGEELAELRAQLERIAEAGAPARKDKLARIVGELGLEGPAATRLIAALRQGRPADEKLPSGVLLKELIRDAAADLVRVAPFPIGGERPAVVTLIGAAGVGKTTTAAKLAARAILDHGQTVTLVSTDGYRVGATEQLARYAELMGAEFASVARSEDLATVVERAKTHLVIVDTEGRSGKRERGAVVRLRSDATHGRENHVVLCVPASLRSVDAARMSRCFAPFEATELAVTKIDETSAPSGLLHGSQASSLPVSVLCFGPNVPDDVAKATTGSVLDYLVPLATRGAKGNQ